MILALSFLLAVLNPELDSYLNAEPKGDHRKGEIEIVTEPETISLIEENQMRRLIKKGLSEIEARESARTGIVAEDIYWIWLRDPVLFPKGGSGTYDRLLWKSALKGPPGVAVLPILPDGKIALNLNFRHATRSWELELPRGLREAGEGAESAASRELQEETGYLVKKLLFLGEIAPDSGALASIMPIYAGWVGEAAESSPEETEAIQGIYSYSLEELEEGFRKGYLIVDPYGKIPLRDSFLAYALFQLKNHSDFLHESTLFSYRCALVRDLSSAFENSLKTHPPLIPIDLDQAKRQHDAYIELLEKLVPEVVRIDGDPNHPDCNFIEDTALIIGDQAVISRMGALERRGEERPVALALEKTGRKIVPLQSPATMDGGDILYAGRHLFVGLSSRTNESALEQLQNIFQNQCEVISISVTEGLHLKSLITCFDSDTLIVADTAGGREIQKEIERLAPSAYRFVLVPDPVASNVLRIGSTLIIQDGFPESEKILKDLCHQKKVQLEKLNMSELIKADGALTCGSLLFN